MERTEFRQLFANPGEFSGKEITVCGWVRTVRDSKNIGFIALNDGSSFDNVQIVFELAKVENYKEIAGQNVGAAIEVTGTFILTPDAGQPFEINASAISVLAPSSPDYPLQKKRHSLEYLRTISHIRPRANIYSAAFRVRSQAAFAIHSFFNSKGFVYAHTPLISCSDCEGAGEMFRVTTLDMDNVPKTENGEVDYSQDFFQKQAFLTVSGQLQGEAMALAFGKIYTFGPTFRAEKSYTQRHAAEFWMIEPEMAFTDLEGDMENAEAMIKYVINYVMETCPQELAFLNKFVDKDLLERLNAVVNSEFGRITYTDAVKILEENNDKFEYKVSWGCDLQTEHERFLTEQIFKRPVFVTDYPKEIKAFYMRLNDDGKTVAAMDCLVMGIGEIIGGSQREERLDLLESRIEELGLEKESYEWYLDLRRYGGVKHSGYGLGFERLIMYLTGISNIRDVLPFPRTTGSADI
ncbi:MAG: asparagine--tRNA ligase [Clostridia bacterium]|nr:asparagine--tRNA ligase [Clostridia bacterium]